MTPERHARAKEVFLEACGRAPGQRTEYIRASCGADAELAVEVERLLRHHHEAPPPPDSGSETTRTALSDQSTHTAGSPAPSAPAAPDPAPARQFTTGQVVGGRFRIVSGVGAGGMGAVYRAEDLRLGQTVALKFLPAERVADAAWRTRLVSEVRSARLVTHPNVCRVFDLEESGGEAFVAMEYVDGEDLRSLLARLGRLTTETALRMARQICVGLAAAHARGILHRDLKPANVMIDGRGDVKLTDFGLAGAAGEFRGAELRAGTPAYMAPEQMLGLEVSARSDLHALGALLYELFTGRAPFRGDSFEALLQSKTGPAPPPPSQLTRDLPAAIDRIVLACLAVNPLHRPESALHVLAELPGGDLLGAAHEAGQTPSPSLVAAAGGRSALPVRAAGLLLAAALLLIGLTAALSPGVHPLGSPAIAKPPEVLADRALELAAPHLVGGAAFDTAYGFLLPEAEDEPPGARDAARAPATPVFWLRASPVGLSSNDPLNAVYGHGRVSWGDPPGGVGEVRVLLDGQGQVLSLESPASQAASRAAADEANEVAGGGDRRLYRGLLLLTMLFIAAPLALRNLQMGRSDPRGATALALLVFGLRAGAWLLAAHHAPDLSLTLRSLFAAVAGWITIAAATWIYYAALEPAVRQHWPQTLIGWSRLQEGRWRDPLVGGHVLLGVTIGAGWALLLHVDALAPQWFAHSQPSVGRVVNVLEHAGGLRAGLAAVLFNLGDAIQIATLLLLLVVLFRVLLRNLPAALVCSGVLFAGLAFPVSELALSRWLLIGMILALGAWLLTRFGLICMIAATFACLLLCRLPLTLDPRAWFAELSVIAIAACGGLALVGYLGATRRPAVA